MAKKLDDMGADCPVFVRIGAFFDGTGNNMNNDLPGRSNSAMTKAYAEHEATIKSGKTTLNSDVLIKTPLFCDDNVTRLYELYQGPDINMRRDLKRPIITTSISNVTYDGKIDEYNGTAFELFAFKEYQVGTGTHDGGKNNQIEMATGAREFDKIAGMMNNIKQQLALFKGHRGPRVIDVFGFSRGSSNARDFINRVNKDWKHLEIEIGFVGIYDTVGSFGLAGDCTQSREPGTTPASQGIVTSVASEMIALVKEAQLKSWSATGQALGAGTKKQWADYKEEFDMRNYYNLHLRKESAQCVVHMTAMDEHRDKFNLVTLKEESGSGANSLPKGANFKEIPMIGVHADIGGGYGPQHRKERYVVEEVTLSYAGLFPAGIDPEFKQEYEVALKGMPSSYNFEQNRVKRSSFKNDLQKKAHEQQRQKMVAKLKEDAKAKGLECEKADEFYDNYFKRVTAEDFKLIYKRKLNCGLNIVYVHLMHKMALKEKVPMLQIAELEKKDPIRFKIPTADDNRLTKYFNYLKSGQPAINYDAQETKKIQANWVHVSSSTSSDFIIPGSANSTDSSQMIPGTEQKGQRWETSWQLDEDGNKSAELITNIGFRQDLWDGEAGDEYSNRGICPNKTAQAILPAVNKLPDGACYREPEPASTHSMSATTS
ncbi:MAG: phospholipase effector Tle1 domain-containing protein [Thiohalomonadales bacterium]